MVRLVVYLALLTMIFSKVNYSDQPVSFMRCIDSHEWLAPKNVSYHKMGRQADLVLFIYLDVTTTPKTPTILFIDFWQSYGPLCVQYEPGCEKTCREGVVNNKFADQPVHMVA